MRKIKNFAALFGFIILYLTAGNLFQYFAVQSKMQTWQIIVDVILFLSTAFYFIYWGRNHQFAQWTLRNLWELKWVILIGFVAMVVWNFGWPVLLNSFNVSLPVGDNQSGLNQLAINTPAWLMWLHVSLGAPIMEESIFRVGIYESILPKHPKIAFVTSALLFASMHMMNSSIGDWRVWGVYIGMGFILSAVYYKSRKVEATVGIHVLWNVLVMGIGG